LVCIGEAGCISYLPAGADLTRDAHLPSAQPPTRAADQALVMVPNHARVLELTHDVGLVFSPAMDPIVSQWPV
jgi:hypothetical protein